MTSLLRLWTAAAATQVTFGQISTTWDNSLPLKKPKDLIYNPFLGTTLKSMFSHPENCICQTKSQSELEISITNWICAIELFC